MEIYTIEELKALMTPVFVKYRLQRAAVFGSYARGTAGKDSDINLLIVIDEDFELNDFIHFRDELTKLTGKNIDIMEYRSINKKRELEILEEAVLLYDERSVSG